ncbi:putative sensor-like histidine kinase [Planctomycetes bacterium Poly30]|uniref:Putative sensor-like histidine kinase n=1 Tax=Saltatorellus ferox TaxID=2528018 RepID=A0A518EN80_9BACT|nr:putative sensor-like histidine kinase [Planctomycetes bacterium Poly30]
MQERDGRGTMQERKEAKEQRTPWLLLVLMWLVPGSMQLVQEATYSRARGLGQFDLLTDAPAYLMTWLPWVLLTPLVASLSRRLRPARIGWPRVLLGHALAACALGTLHLVMVGWLRVHFPPEHWPADWVPASVVLWLRQSFWSFQPQGELLAYGVVLAASLAGEERRRVAASHSRALRLEARLAEAKLTALQGQLRPHFLFNALNSCLVLVQENPAAAERMLRRISELLRRSLESDERGVVPLHEELDVVELYLGIERTRFADRLRTHVDVTGEALEAEVPAWLLQPLVENAIRHGLAPRREGGQLWIRGRRTDSVEQRLLLIVEDDGVGLEVGASAGRTVQTGGVGLENARARLEAIYGANATLELGPRTGGGTRLEIELPASIPVDAGGQATHA